MAAGRLRKEHYPAISHARYKCLELHASGKYKGYNWIAVEDLGVVVRHEFGGVGSDIFGRVFCALQRSLCKDIIHGL